MLPAVQQVVFRKRMPVRSGLMAWYEMNEGSGQVLWDLSGNGNNGTLGADATSTGDPDWVAEGLDFVAANGDQILTSSHSPTGARTFIVVCNQDTSGGNNSPWILGPGNGGAAGFTLSRSSNTSIGYANGSVFFEKTLASTNAWHMYWVRTNGAGADVSYDLAAPTNNASYTFDTFTSGFVLSSNAARFDGKMAAVLIYNRGLSDGEIAQNFYYSKSVMARRGIAL